MARVVCANAALYVALAFPVALGMLGPRPGDPAWWVQGAGLALLAVAVAAGRARPLLSLLIVAGLCAVHGNFVFGFPVMAYLTGRRLAGARQVLWAFTGICVAGAAFNIARGVEVTEWFPVTIYLVLLGVLPWLAGRAWRQYQELVYAGWERAEWLEHQQRITAERERLRERARIARDMHDSLGHELALRARLGHAVLTPYSLPVSSPIVGPVALVCDEAQLVERGRDAVRAGLGHARVGGDVGQPPRPPGRSVPCSPRCPPRTSVRPAAAHRHRNPGGHRPEPRSGAATA
ncbi:hypothetical protein Acsp03_08350 [Actinomadura sp. NBRC 104412]|nr:hypothetical protein Acsp03_08350 [Actinomadura sp. NBRC 104412]